MLSDLLYRLRALLHRDSVEEELDAELRFHLEQQTEMYVRSGLSVEEAARRARLMFGGIDGVKEHCRDARGLARIETLWQDIRYGLRGLRRAPAFAAVVVGTIALGIGVNTAAFTIFNAYVLRPVPVQEPYSLFRFTWSNRAGRGHTFTWPEYKSSAGTTRFLRACSPIETSSRASTLVWSSANSSHGTTSGSWESGPHSGERCPRWTGPRKPARRPLPC